MAMMMMLLMLMMMMMDHYYYCSNCLFCVIDKIPWVVLSLSEIIISREYIDDDDDDDDAY